MVDVELMLWPCGEPRLPIYTVADVGSAGQLSVRGLMALEYTIVYALTGSFPPIYCFLRLFGCLVLSPGTFNNTELFSLFFLRQSWFRAPYRLVRLFYLFLYITKISLFAYCKFWVNTAIFSIKVHKFIPPAMSNKVYLALLVNQQQVYLTSLAAVKAFFAVQFFGMSGFFESEHAWYKADNPSLAVAHRDMPIIQPQVH